MAITNVVYFHGTVEDTYLKKIKVQLEDKRVSYCLLSQMYSIELHNFSHIIVTGNLQEIKEILAFALRYDKSIGIVPQPSQKELMKTFALSASLKESVEQALQQTENKIDVLYANDEIVLQEVVIGDAPPLDQFSSTLKKEHFFKRTRLFFYTLAKVKHLHHCKIKIIDANENEINFSAVGLVGLAYNNDTFAAKLIAKEINAADGKLSLIILSPISIVQYIGYLSHAYLSFWRPDKLPASTGYMSSKVFKVESNRPLEVLIDTEIRHETPVVLKTEERVLALSVGEKFWEKQSQENNGKDSIKIDHLPSDDESANYLSKAIPFFSHASKEQYASLFTNLREESKLSQNFMVLLVLATMIATFGLFINSSSVVIGAMLLAPLMQPIVSLSMGVLRQDSALELNGAKTIAIGVLAVLLTAGLIALFIPIERLTSEMAGRLSPTILDLFVAIASGIAAAYAKSNEKILGSLAGVAIAVALVPPLAVAGIGLGWMDWHMFSSAFLLFITNLVGIVLAAAFTFAILGYSPLHLAKKGIVIWFTIVAVVSIPLYSSFSKMKEDIRVQKVLSGLVFNVGRHDVKLTQIELLHRGKTNEIRCEVISTGVLNKVEKIQLKENIMKSIDKNVTLIVTFRYHL